MKNFGIYKSKIEKLLVESYSKGTIKENLVKFKNIVLSDRNLRSAYFIYDELSTNKGMDKEIAKEYIEECVKTFNNIKLNTKQIKVLENWLSSTKETNQYTHIDNLFNTDVLQLENKISSKKMILETLVKKSEKKITETVNIPLKSAISLANKTLSGFVETLNESDRKEFLEIATMKDDQVIESFNELKKSVITKLENLLETNTETDTKNKIKETIEKINLNSPDKQNYYKLKKLNESI